MPGAVADEQRGRAAARSAEPLSAAELADRLVPTDPRIAPDGSAVAFTVASRGKRGRHQERAVWLARVGDEPRPLTAAGRDNADPRWSPVGTRLLFTSDREAPEAERGEERRRLYLLRRDGGEAVALGDLTGELSAPEWSPDGRWVALLRKDPEEDERRRRREAGEDAIVVDEAERTTRLWLVDAASGKARCLTEGRYRVWSFAWLPTGDELVMVTTEGRDLDATYGPADLRLVPVAGGLPRPLARFPTLPSNPVVLGRNGECWQVAVRANEHRADPSDSLWLVTAGERRNLLPDYRGVVAALAPLSESSEPGVVVARVVEGTHAVIVRCEGGDEGVTVPLLATSWHGRGSVIEGPSLAADGSKVAFVWSSGTEPEEVFLGEIGGEPVALTAFGERFRDRLCPVEVVRWTSDDGVAIEGLLTYPTGYETGTRYPLVVEVHGGPSWQWEERAMLDWHDWAQLLASRGYAVLAPNPRGSTAYGSVFQRMLQDDVGGGELRDLTSGARAMVERGIADGARLGIAGWSWGGYLTAWAVTQTDLFKAAVMGAGLANLVSDHGQNDIPAMNGLLFPGDPYRHREAYCRVSPIHHVAAVTTPTLILHGDADARVHPAQGMEFYRALKTLGVPTTFVRYPREEHTISERAHQIDLLKRLIGWFDRWLAAESADEEFASAGRETPLGRDESC